jgi:menaquinone-dependent protoporphyrinogen oxidase
MNILVAYSSHTGVTRLCAESLANHMPGSTLSDLSKEKPDPSAFDIVAVGGSIRMGALDRHVREYLENCAPILSKKTLGVFICCGYDEKSGEYFRSNLPESLYSHAVKASFGGKLDPEGAKGLDRFMIKLMVKSAAKNGETMAFYPERIPEFAAKLIDTASGN